MYSDKATELLSMRSFEYSFSVSTTTCLIILLRNGISIGASPHALISRVLISQPFSYSLLATSSMSLRNSSMPIGKPLKNIGLRLFSSSRYAVKRRSNIFCLSYFPTIVVKSVPIPRVIAVFEMISFAKLWIVEIRIFSIFVTISRYCVLLVSMK